MKRSLYLTCLWFVTIILIQSTTADAWEWTDWIKLPNKQQLQQQQDNYLSLSQVSELRVRDIKRILARKHGYAADELGRMLDKKELIHALAFEEEKVRQLQESAMKRTLMKQGIIMAVIAVLLVMCWPLLQQGYQVAKVNFVVYTDRKRHEVTRCLELKSVGGMIGVFCMFVMDLLQLWLTVSILLSWFMTRSKYFFPVPSLPIRPAQLMGGEISKTSLSNYGINIGPMLIGWLLRFVHGRLERWTGQALSHARKAQRKEARRVDKENETPEDRAARLAARRQARRAAKRHAPPAEIPEEWMQPIGGSTRPTATAATSTTNTTTTTTSPPMSMSQDPNNPAYSGNQNESERRPADSRAHQEFLDQLNEPTSSLNDLD